MAMKEIRLELDENGKDDGASNSKDNKENTNANCSTGDGNFRIGWDHGGNNRQRLRPRRRY